MVLVRGDVVLLVAGVGLSVAPAEARSGALVVADRLTVEVARLAVRGHALGVITAGGNFACHGANLLRAARAAGQPIGWIRGVDVLPGVEVEVSHDGVCIGPVGCLGVSRSPHDGDLFEYVKSGTEWSRVCLWPDRRYSRLEFELQAAGLAACMSDLADRRVYVRDDEDGRIWFSEGSLTSSDLADLVQDPVFREDYLTRMYGDYQSLQHDLLIGNMSREAVQGWALLFFSTLLPFHRTYGVALQLEAELADPSDSIRPLLLNKVLTGPITEWLVGRQEFDSASKRLCDPRWEGLLPADSLEEMVDSLVASCLRIVREAAHVEIQQDALRRLCVLGTVKEMKMVLAKNIFALWGAAHRSDAICSGELARDEHATTKDVRWLGSPDE